MSARLKCLQTIIAANGANKPGSEPSLDALGIKINEAEVLVRSGAAAWADPVAVAAEPAVVPVTDPVPVEAELAGVMGADGTVRELEEMKRAELMDLAEAIGVPRAAGMNKQQLVDAILAERVKIDANEASAFSGGDDDAGAEG